MRTFLVVLLGSSRIVDDHDNTRALAGLFLSVNPYLPMTPVRYRGTLHSTGGAVEVGEPGRRESTSQVGQIESAANANVEMDTAVGQAADIEADSGQRLFSNMRTLLFALLGSPRIVDDHDNTRATARLFLDFTPYMPVIPVRSRQSRRSTGPAVEVGDPGRTDFASQIGPIENPADKNLQVDAAAIDQAADIETASGIPETVATPHKSDVRKRIGESATVLVQGRSLKTWSYRSFVDRVQVVLNSDGRPLDADVQLWQGPDNTPYRIRVYSEDGCARPFSAVMTTPNGGTNTIAIRNVGQLEFPLGAYVIANDVDEPISDFRDNAMIVQGGSLRTYHFNTSTESVEIMLKTDGRPLKARIELLQGPNNNKQAIELYSEDGLERPFWGIIETIGGGNVVRVVNMAPIEFPMIASVQTHSINEKVSGIDPDIGGGQ